jgi:acetyl-CoA carboxylase biotin carboxyl carrier protein
MNDHELAEIDLRQADQRIRLRRDVDPIVMPAAVSGSGSAPNVAASDAPAPAADENMTLVKSPIIGTFYTASSPDASAFVKVGDTVNSETTVCIIEAMKVFNEIPAECNGKIVARLCENGDAVEYGQPLFKVDTRG